MREEWVLCLYYFLGIVQNLVICSLKKYYDNTTTTCSPQSSS